jgi:ribose 5-phosphate isomerase A
MMDLKEAAARSAVAAVESGMVLGLGTGSTAMKMLAALAERVHQEGLRIVGIPTSLATEREAMRLEIPLTNLTAHPEIDLALDGADQVDARLDCIKGYGGALLREKIVARCARRFILMVDAGKMSPQLDKPVPVEVLPFGTGAARAGLETMGGKPVLRKAAGEIFVTDNGNHVFDVAFGVLHDVGAIAQRIAAIPGVVDHGLFVGLAAEAHIASAAGLRVQHRAP